MKFIHTAVLCTALLGTGLLAGCQDDIENYDNCVYWGETDKVEMVLVDVEAGEAEKEGEVKTYLTKPHSTDVCVTYGVDASLVNRYNSLNNDNAELLPAGFYKIDDLTVRIKAGEVTASGLAIDFVKLDQLDFTKTYVLPLAIVSSDVNILDSQRAVYYVIKKAALVNWAANLRNNNVYVDWKNPSVVQNLHTLTAEALIKVDAFANDRDSKITTIMGIEDHFLIRLGDNAIPSNQLQIAADGRDNVTASDWTVRAGVWNHLAVTFNGDTKTIQVYINGRKKSEQVFKEFAGPVNWGVQHSDESDGKPRCFWIGYSYNDQRYLDGSIAECRIWNRVLTEEEIGAANHFYRISPDSEGLVSYWKFNDGMGDTVKDYTTNGNNATASESLVWNYVELPE